MKTANLISYGFLCVFSITLLVYFIPTYSPPFEGEGVPATLLPQVLAWIILILSGFLFVAEALRKYATQLESPIGISQWVHLGKYAISFVAIIVTFIEVGFIAGGIVGVTLLQLLAGQKRPALFVAIALGIPCLLYAGIWYGLRTPLP